jgi:hypothetical protein
MASITNAAASLAANAVTARLNNGFLRLYSGVAPANANAALSGNTLLAQKTFGATAFGAAVNGVATANAIGQDASNDASGTATFFRAFESDGVTVVFQGTVAVEGAELNLPSTNIVAGGITAVSSFTYAQALAT